MPRTGSGIAPEPSQLQGGVALQVVQAPFQARAIGVSHWR